MVTITLCVHSLPILYSFFVIASSSSFSSSSCVVEPYIGSTWSPSSSSSLSGYRFSRVEILLFLIYWVSSSLHSLQHIYIFRCLRYLLFLFPFLPYQWSPCWWPAGRSTNGLAQVLGYFREGTEHFPLHSFK